MRRRTSRTALVLMLLLSACGGAAAPSAPAGSSPATTATPVPSRTAAATATAAALPDGVIALIPTDQGPIVLAASDKLVWVETHRADHLSQIDPQQNVEVARLTKVQAHCEVVAGAGFIWATRAATSIVSKVDPASGDKVGTISLQDACGIAVDDHDVWVASPGLGKVVRYDVLTLEERASVAVGQYPFGVAIGTKAIWVVGEAEGGTVWRVNPATNKVVAKISTPLPYYTGVVVGHGSVWVPTRDNLVIYRIDPATNSIAATIKLPTQIGGIGAGPDAIWSSGFGDGKVYRIDPKTNTITGSVSTGLGNLGPPLVAFGSVWVSALDRNLVARIDPEAVR